MGCYDITVTSPHQIHRTPLRYFIQRQLNQDNRKGKLRTAGKARALHLMPRVARYLSAHSTLLATIIDRVTNRTTVNEAKAPSPQKS